MIFKNFFKTVLTVCLMVSCWMPVCGQNASLRGDVDGNGAVGMDDLSAMINYLLTNDAKDINLDNANCDGLEGVGMDDLSALINYLLTNQWPYVYECQSFTVSGVTFKMVLVRGGTYMMGGRDFDPNARPWEFPAHEVTLSDYYIGETEVTQALWVAVMGSYNNPSWFTSSNGYSSNLNRPVERVSYSQCKSFITKLNQKTGKTFRIPTEAEWEFAARGGNWSKGYLYSGSDNLDDVAWSKFTAGEMTHPVATKAPNELGLYDMSGNVEEWCNDYYGLYSSDAQQNPTGPTTGSYRVIRGGCWDQIYRSCRVTYRYDGIPGTESNHYGLRLAM